MVQLEQVEAEQVNANYNQKKYGPRQVVVGLNNFGSKEAKRLHKLGYTRIVNCYKGLKVSMRLPKGWKIVEEPGHNHIMCPKQVYHKHVDKEGNTRIVIVSTIQPVGKSSIKFHHILFW